ncbi:hypothetical protein D3C79_728550 [compost metagenome]
MSEHGKVAAMADRFEERRRGAPAAAVANRHIVIASAFLSGAVEVGVIAVPGTQRGLHEGFAGSVAIGRADVELAVASVILVTAAVVHFALAKVRQNIVEAPAFVAQRLPVIEVVLMAANVDHAVDRTAASEHLASGLVAYPPAQTRLWGGLECPVDVARWQDGSQAQGRMDKW